jgi:phosphomannomutase
MAETKSPLAGELSGHIFFADKYYGYDDALYCAVRLMNAMGDTDGSLSSLTADLPVLHSTAEERFEVDEAEKFDLVPRVAENLKALQADQKFEINEIDGVRVITEDGWWLLRPSNTQSVLVARAEGTSAEGLERLVAMAQKAVKDIGYDLKF